MKPSDIFTCSECGNFSFKDFIDNLKICDNCGHVISKEEITNWRKNNDT